MADSLKVGDVVRLGLVGREMTVQQILPRGKVLCTWFEGNKWDGGTFDIGFLQKVVAADEAGTCRVEDAMLAPGDTVELMSGGPPMKLKQFDHEGRADCLWLSGHGQDGRHCDPRLLRKVSPG